MDKVQVFATVGAAKSTALRLRDESGWSTNQKGWYHSSQDYEILNATLVPGAKVVDV